MTQKQQQQQHKNNNNDDKVDDDADSMSDNNIQYRHHHHHNRHNNNRQQQETTSQHHKHSLVNNSHTPDSSSSTTSTSTGRYSHKQHKQQQHQDVGASQRSTTTIMPTSSQLLEQINILASPCQQCPLPLFRGKIHLILVCISPLWIFLLLSACQTWQAYLASIIASFAGFINFLSSALLHNISWSSSRVHDIVERIDHAAIFLMISGSTTPIPLLLLTSPMATSLLLVQWGATLYGMLVIFFGSLSDVGSRRKRSITYVCIGLCHCLFICEYVRVLTSGELLLVIGLGIIYILGAVIYARKSPDPFPGYFGFHEMFHLCCLASAVCTFYLNLSVLNRAG
eukprot:GHVS01041084.1.p1 GENE.GHVS01041084.1~~GHVS01041084.1.p1  ORF type:complete len:358 (+),score=62.88 GHVS01041084.1:55-1074(+)